MSRSTAVSGNVFQKKLFFGLKTLKVGVKDAFMCFTNGSTKGLEVFRKVGYPTRKQPEEN